jgi:hypothetical protein
MFLGSKVRPVRRADNLTAVCEPLSIQCAILNISQPYRPPLPVTEIALLLLTEMSIRSWKILLLRSRARPVRKTDNLTSICDPIV